MQCHDHQIIEVPAAGGYRDPAIAVESEVDGAPAICGQVRGLSVQSAAAVT
jgi:hypothetical protein